MTLLADSMAITGGGFNIQRPGQSNASAEMRNWPHEEASRVWRNQAAFRRESGIFFEGLQNQLALPDVEVPEEENCVARMLEDERARTTEVEKKLEESSARRKAMMAVFGKGCPIPRGKEQGGGSGC
jgi:hypothetical protein